MYNKRTTLTTRKKCGSYIERKGLYKTQKNEQIISYTKLKYRTNKHKIKAFRFYATIQEKYVLACNFI